MDAVLAIAHHLAAFALVALLVGELILLRGSLDADGIRQFGFIDLLYGAAAGTVVAAGLARLVFGPIAADVYFANAFFWLKMASFGVVAAVSAYATVSAVQWRRSLKRDDAFRPAADAVARVRRAVALELAVVPLIPASAALMARGYGAL